MYAIKEITEKQVLRWDYKQTKHIYHSSWFYGWQQRNNRSFYSESQKYTCQVVNHVWYYFEIPNKLICYFFVVNHKIRMNDIYVLFVCNPNKERDFQWSIELHTFLKFNSSINLSFFARSERSMYIKAFNSACISIPPHSRAARSFFLFAFSRWFSSFFYQEVVLDFLMRVSIPSLPHCIYQLDFFSYT